MNLLDLESLDSFALLGPGFTGGEFVLLRDLVADPTGQLVMVPFETKGRDALVFRGEPTGVPEPSAPSTSRGINPVLDDSGHESAVTEIREAIAAGDVYQVNLTLRAKFGGVSGAEVFETLVRNTGPRFAAWVRMPDQREFVSASPESLYSRRRNTIVCEPMKGTAKPGQEKHLRESKKDAAELAMITDLIRNDLTPLCVPRSVEVVDPRRFLELPYAIQTVSIVRGELSGDPSTLSILDALHPCGSVTGAPKKAAISAIKRLETSPRSLYCGALGYRQQDVESFSVLIRTAERTAAGWTYGVGGGIVWDSDPGQELEEIYLKLGALR